MVRRALAIAALALLVPAGASGAQEAGARTPHADAYWYGRLGYGLMALEGRYGGPSFAFGRRLEHDAFGFDLLLASGQAKILGTGPADLDTIGGIYTHAYFVTALTVKALYVMQPEGDATVYLGAGTGWSALSFGRSGAGYEDWHHRGMAAAFTVGYAFARTDTSTRIFVEVDVSQPWRRVKQYASSGEVIGDRRVTILVVSLGAGW